MGGSVFPGFGTIVNTVAIVACAAAGLSLGKVIPVKLRDQAQKAIGLAIVVIGFSGAIGGLGDLSKVDGPIANYGAIVLVGSLVVGTVIGSLLGIEDWLNGLGKKLVARFKADGDSHRIVEGFVTATLIYAIGAMTILGAIQDGLGNPNTLLLKAVLDGTTSIFLAATFGYGVALSALPVLLVQGVLVLGTLVLGNVIDPTAIIALEAVGGAMIAAIGLDVLDIKRLPVGNMLPALGVAMLIGWLM